MDPEDDYSPEDAMEDHPEDYDEDLDDDTHDSVEGDLQLGDFDDMPETPEEEEAYIRHEFANPGSNSALRAAGPNNPRNLPCPTCGEPNKLTPKDRALGYQCDDCADRAEGGGY